MAQLKNTTIDDTGFLQLPGGPTSTRPVQVPGAVRWNTDYSWVEYYNDIGWVTPLGMSSDYPATNALEIIQASPYPFLPDGYYWINVPSLGPRLIYCLMNPAIDGGGWMGVTSEISPKISNANTNATWVTSGNMSLYGDNEQRLDVSIVEVSCGVNSFYLLRSPDQVGLQYDEAFLVIQRINTIGQCSVIPNRVYQGYFSGPRYVGQATSGGMCNWGDGYFANACCDSQDMTGLQMFWVMKSEGASTPLRYAVSCGSGIGGSARHQWFIR